MTRFLDKSFSVHAGTGQEYRDRWDRIFKKEEPAPCARADRDHPEDDYADESDRMQEADARASDKASVSNESKRPEPEPEPYLMPCGCRWDQGCICYSRR